ncbi:MAG TPA: glycine/betaine/sarcosine/D-proline family reductase selenoprotein B [Thermoanaerobacterales bacterium]|jgi:betaine reductase|nr:glycine/betaine/sarcosine/D-proline family reductase selenoprotein B [Thermoanaerobacterales bacterium]
MARELESAGIPVAHICTMINVSKSMGGNRLVPSRSVLHPTGDPDLTLSEEFKLRQKIVSNALQAIQTEIKEPTVFE